MSDYLLEHGTRVTPQSEPIAPEQIRNAAGGYAWKIDKFARLRRWLILGSEGGTYYTGQKQFTAGNIKSLRECIAEDGARTVETIVEISEGGRAPKNDPALYALAAAFSFGDKDTKLAAGVALPRVARIGTHLYHFVAYMETMRGWGRMARKAVSEWYASKPVDRVEYDAVKYRQRDGWSHRDMLRLAHPDTPRLADVYDWIAHPDSNGDREGAGMIEGFIKAQAATSPAETAALIREYRLPREAIMPEHAADIAVWEALVDTGMPPTAMIRNLANMTRAGLFNSGEHLDLVVAKLTDQEALRKARVHPMAILLALATYASGQGFRGQNNWTPVADVSDALDRAFYLAFENVEPVGSRMLLGVDVSASMNQNLSGFPISARACAAAMALVTVNAEPKVTTVGFTDRMHTVSFSRRQRLDDALARMPYTGEGTDCAVPILTALNRPGVEYDSIVLFTDGESWAGKEHTSQAITRYRQKLGKPVRLIVCALTATRTSIVDPNDPLSMEVVGFDTAAPGLISQFAGGQL